MRKVGALAVVLLVSGCVTGEDYGRRPYRGGYEPPPPSSGRTVHISDATYRAPDGRQCDAKRAVRSMCEDQNSCSVRASNDLCGDPANGVEKKLVIGYKCGDGRVETSVTERRSVTLSCSR